MNPQDLLKKTIAAEASKSSSDFEDILHRTDTRRAKIEYGDFRQITKSDLGDRDIQDEISFLDVAAPFVSKGDSITYPATGADTVDYFVEYFTLVIPGIYKIFATKKVRTGSML